MNGAYDSCYRALGLSPRASPAEIKAAYRRLAKKYHPDRDKSMDAELKFKEIRAAYETLRDWHLAGAPGLDVSAPPVDTVEWMPKDWVWTPKDWTTEYDLDLDELIHGVAKTSARIPFSPANLPAVFMASLRELANAGIVLQALLALFIISFCYSPEYARDRVNQSVLSRPIPREAYQVKPYKNLVRTIALTSGLAVVVLRYYVTLRRKGFFLCAFVTLAYPTAVTLLVKRFYPGEPGLYTVWFCFYIASIILACNPLGALSKPVGFILWNMFKRK
jgi:hypothetical protein